MTFHNEIKSKVITRSCFCTLLVVMLVLSLLPFRGAALTTTVAVNPPTSIVALYQTFEINITVNNVANFSGWSWDLDFRNDVLTCLDVVEGPFLKTVNGTFFNANILNSYNGTYGRIDAYCVAYGMTEVDGSGVVATLTFETIGESRTLLHIVNSKLSDEMANPIAHTDSDGFVQVTGPSPEIYIAPNNLSGPPDWMSINGTFVVNVSISCPPAFDLNLNYWQAGVTFNPTVLQCVSFTEGPFLANVSSTIWQPGVIDNNAGIVTPSAAHLASGIGANGNGTLAYIAFKVIDTGSSSLVLQDVQLFNSSDLQISITVQSGYFDLPPEIPKPPTAFFAYSPTSPYVNDTITFDASGSTANNVNSVIVEYDWDFGDNSQGQGMILNHSYPTAALYNVTLVVKDDKNMTSSFSQLLTVIAIPVGASIDLYMSKGGKGLNQPSDTYAPEEEVFIYAYATYDLVPVPGKVVTFIVNYPNGSQMQSRQITTDNNGIAFFAYLILAVPVFGTYVINASVTVGTKTVSDTCRFGVNWLVQVASAVPCDMNEVPTSYFEKGEPLYFMVTIRNNRFLPTYARVSVTVEDYLTQLVIFATQVYYVQPNVTTVFLSAGIIPQNAYTGIATAYVSAREVLGGHASPEVSVSFMLAGPRPNIAIINANLSTFDTYVGHSVKISVDMLGKYYLWQNCNVTLYANSTLIGAFNMVPLPPWQETTYTYVWHTDGFSQGYYNITVMASPLPNESDLSDNNYAAGIVHLGPHVSPLHDISVISISSDKSMVGNGYSTVLSITLYDEGDYNETSNLTLYANLIAIPNATFQSISFTVGNQIVETFTWNTTGFGYGNYTLTGVLDLVPNEADLDDNIGFSQNVRIGVPGDVSGNSPGVPDGLVNMRDVAYMVYTFNKRPSSSGWNSNADVNGDGIINIKDIAIAIHYFNQRG